MEDFILDPVNTLKTTFCFLLNTESLSESIIF